MTDAVTDTAPAASDSIDEPTVDTTPATESVDYAAEAAKWRDLARKHEARSKANAKAAEELEALRASQQTDTERAIAEAEKRGRQAASTDFGQKLAAARIEAALTGIVPDPAAIIEDLNLAKYVTDTGDVDPEAITALREKFATLAAKATPPPTYPDLAQGQRGTPPAGQLTRGDLAGMSPEAIEAARLDGRLNSVLGIKN